MGLFSLHGEISLSSLQLAWYAIPLDERRRSADLYVMSLVFLTALRVQRMFFSYDSNVPDCFSEHVMADSAITCSLILPVYEVKRCNIGE